MKNYYRVMLGKKSAYVAECLKKGVIAAGFLFDHDLSSKLAEDWREFNKKIIPIYLKAHPEKRKIAAGLSCGFLWTIAKGIREGDIVFSPDGDGRYHVGEVTGSYFYREGEPLPHQRPVNWYSQTIDRSEMSTSLQHSIGSLGTVCNISRY